MIEGLLRARHGEALCRRGLPGACRWLEEDLVPAWASEDYPQEVTAEGKPEGLGVVCQGRRNKCEDSEAF